MAVEKITAWRTEDGKLYDNEEEAKYAEEGLSVAKRIRELLEFYGWRGMTLDEIAKMLIDNRAEFYQALKRGNV
jgi:hypothetical protein